MSEILLVGGRSEELRMLADVLVPLGHRLLTASSGEEALRLLAERDLALVVVGSAEGASPEPSPARERAPWVAAAREIGSRGRGANTPIVFMTEFAELEADRRALKRSAALLRGAFEAAPIGKTVLDSDRRIIRANRAFALLLGTEAGASLGTEITSLAHPEDRENLAAALTRVAEGDLSPEDPDRSGFEVRLRSSSGIHVSTGAYVSAIDPAELGEQLLMIQWVDLTARRHAERVRAELELEHLARAQAEATAERLNKLQDFTVALEALSLDELLPELARRLAEQFDAQAAEVRLDARPGQEANVVRAAAGRTGSDKEDNAAPPAAGWQETPLIIDGSQVGSLRLVPSADASFSGGDRALLAEFADRAALVLRRAQLHEQEHRIAVTLQRGLLPTRLPQVIGLELTAYYEPAGDVGEVGGDWYDAFELDPGRLGIVLGDVAGKGIQAASTMGQLRSVTRAFALGDEQRRPPGDVLTRLNRHELALGAQEMFTVLYAILDTYEGIVCWANAGHPPPLLHRRDGGYRYLEGGEGLMGIDEIAYRDMRQPIAENDTLIFYTDGLVERRGESLDAGLDRLARAVATGPEDPRALCQHIAAAVVAADGRPADDVTIVVARVTGRG